MNTTMHTTMPPADPPITLLIADDHPLILAGLASLIASLPGLLLLGQAGTGSAAVELYRQLRPDVVLMDLNMPEMHGVEAIERICADDAQAKIVILTTYQGEDSVHRALRAGARGYLLKDSGFLQLTQCIRQVAAGRHYLPPELAAQQAGRIEANRLSKREHDILLHLSAGKSNKMIARSAGIEVGTVKFHVNNILTKLNVSSRTEAATVAARRGLLGAF
ncbi:response regulator transcription factor [Janthinobacterium lividum]|uniref:Response regulator transcription factor n=3 Tax=Janthinobacterium lividum TaxID=29581 RepID=A0ABU0XUR6_9BURK|nr:response regulator transcription factor [Janthinobacterium lividum]MDQ4626181.1 response regulator transcription factor [Janthinobacterium lividum]MDQ4674852.1 response regulator transcription factor [Janthinobacterium lividum]